MARAIAKIQYREDEELKERLLFAYNVGWGRGYHDKHYEPRNFATGGEWLAWLSGWRQGQAERKADLRSHTAALERLDCVMVRLLTLSQVKQIC